MVREHEGSGRSQPALRAEAWTPGAALGPRRGQREGVCTQEPTVPAVRASGGGIYGIHQTLSGTPSAREPKKTSGKNRVTRKPFTSLSLQMGANGSRDAPLEGESTFINSTNNARAARGGGDDVDMELGARSGAYGNVDEDSDTHSALRARSEGGNGIETQSPEHVPDGAIMSHEVLPRHLAGLEWEILGLLDQTRPFTQAVIQQLDTTHRDPMNAAGGTNGSRRRYAKQALNHPILVCAEVTR